MGISQLFDVKDIGKIQVIQEEINGILISFGKDGKRLSAELLDDYGQKLDYLKNSNQPAKEISVKNELASAAAGSRIESSWSYLLSKLFPDSVRRHH